MVCKKIAGIFLFLSFQSFCMLTVQQKRWQRQYPERIILCPNRIENYKFNEQFFNQRISLDILSGSVIPSLDYKSNIQLIRTCKYLYERYATGQTHKLLCTDHYLSSDDYTKAMVFHARKNDEEKIELLIQHEGEENRNNREAILKYFQVTNADGLETVIDVYRQVFPNYITKFDTITYGESGFYKEYCVKFKHLSENAALLQLLLKQGLYPNSTNDKNEPLLLKITDRFFSRYKKDILKLIKILLADPYTDPNMHNANGNTALRHAIIWHKDEIIKVLLADPRTNPTMQDKNGDTVLKRINWDTPEITEILSKNPWVNGNMSNEYGDFALIEVVKKNNIKAIEFLLTNSQIDPNREDEYGNIALIKAVENNNIKAVQLLLAHSQTDPNIQTKYWKDTALIIATKQNNIEILKILLADPRIDANMHDSCFNTAYYYAKDSSTTDPEIIRILSEKTSFFCRDKVFTCWKGVALATLLSLGLYDKYIK